MCFGKCSEGVEHVEEVVRKKKEERGCMRREGERTSTRAKRRVVARTHRTHTRLSHNSHSDPTPPPQRKTLIGQAHPPQKAGMRPETTVFGHETGGKRVFFLFAFCTPRSRDRSHRPSVRPAGGSFFFTFLLSVCAPVLTANE